LSAFFYARRLGQVTPRVAVVAVLVGLAAIAGVLLDHALAGHSTGTPPAASAPPRAITHQGVRIGIPSGWAAGGAATIPGFDRSLGLRNPTQQLSASVQRLPATSATLLPAGFLRALRTPPGRPDVVRLDSGARGWRYHFSGKGSATTLYAVPTTSGVATVACSGSGSDDTGIAPGCEALAGGITTPGSRLLAPGTHAGFFSRLPAALAHLDAARVTGTRQLDAATGHAGQALAADRLAQAHEAAAGVLAPLAGARSGLPTATVGVLADTGAAYAELARAARTRSPQRYAAAARAVAGAEGRLSPTMRRVAAAMAAAIETGGQGASPPGAHASPTGERRPVGPTAAVRPSEGTDPLPYIIFALILGLLAVSAVGVRRRQPR
jgi:hypothetical protein